jgi:ubiquinone/menaquinone biosynthesis C-methylase UbiE
MSKSLSFDRAADFYDQTRPLFEPIATHGIRAILEQTGPTARILDVGTGTGRISVPLLERGADLVGCDLSANMLKKLVEKYPAAQLAQADASRLPFPDARFDAALTVHVLHLIPVWRDVLGEIRRVLAPGGVYLNVRTWASAGASVREAMRHYWRHWLEVRGVDAGSPGMRNHEEFQQQLSAMGAARTEVEVVRFALSFTLREQLERFISRTFSDAWDIPDDLHAASIKELRAWVEQEYGDLDQERQDPVRFMMDVVRFND